MSPFNRDYELGKQYQLRQHQQAQKHELIQLAKSNHPKRTFRMARVYKPTLFRLGKQLEALGTTLQIRYGDLKPSSYKR